MAYTTIKKPSDYFNTVTYTGNGSTQSINVGMQPDFTWTKNRGSVANHREQDSVRGTGFELYPNLTDVEATGVSNAITSWTSTGYDIGSSGGINTNSANYVSWNWKANGGTGVSNTDGSISSTVSANTTSGFSIVSYTGTGSTATVGHGLGAVPSVIIVKDRDSGVLEWAVYHKYLSLGSAGYYLRLNSSTDSGSTTAWNSTLPTSSVFSVGAGTESNTSGNNIIAYCFTDVQGYSKFGSYTGNGSSDGTFVYTGFKPAFVMFKIINTIGNWYLNDTTRRSINVNSYTLFPNLSDAETTTGANIDMLSNGFKLRDTGAAINGSGNNFIYMAFAEEPLVGDNPATAR